jgi:anti-sigma factor RsiW
MEDHRIGDLLRELPRERARSGFTARVLGRLDAGGAGRPALRRRPAAALAAAALAAVAIPAGLLVEEAADRRKAAEARRMLEEIRAEHSRLASELEELSEPPVIYLGGDENVDFVLDLRRVPEAGGEVRPATYADQTF